MAMGRVVSLRVRFDGLVQIRVAEMRLNPSFPLMRPSDGHGESRFPSNTIRRFSAIACGGNAF